MKGVVGVLKFPLCTVFCHFTIAGLSAGFVNVELLSLFSADL